MSIANFAKAIKAMKAKKMSIEYFFQRALHLFIFSMLIHLFAMLISSLENQLHFMNVSMASSL